jgi:hypothetical protein
MNNFLSELFDKIQIAITEFVANKKREEILKMQAETTHPQWGDEKVFKQGEASKVSNVAFKKPEPMQKKEPLLK